ncbi:MAG: YfcE family phosphodiesterase [Spirochaetes bacterium]|nr:YfcE family phosphodiesterase [Spirochaetota bacterium]
MKILVVSDSHGNSERLRRIVDAERPFQYLVHCGDGVNDLLHAGVPADAVTLAVAGNVDLGRGITGERILWTRIGGRAFMITHGDLFGAHNGLSGLEREAARGGADIVLFGHTHVRHLREEPPAMLNPGSANNGWYGLVEIDGDVRFSHRQLA